MGRRSSRWSGLATVLGLLVVAAPDRATALGAAQWLTPETLPPDFYTFSTDEFWRKPRDSYWINFSNWVIGQEHAQSERVEALGAWADRTLSGAPRAMPGNESYLRLGVAAESRTGKLANLEPEVRFRLDLPTAEEQLRVVLESESDELIPLGERSRSRQLTDDQRSDTDATGALRYLSVISDTVNLSNDVGARLRFPPDAFWRATARGNWQWTDWRLGIRQRAYYFHRDGWGASTWLGFSRDIGNGWTFLASSEAVWVHDERQFDLAQVFDFHKRLNNRSELNPRLGVLGESQPTWRHTGYFADLTWRYRLYHDWLYGEVIPSIEFERDNHFKEDTALLFRLEMFFSGHVRQR